MNSEQRSRLLLIFCLFAGSFGLFPTVSSQAEEQPRDAKVIQEFVARDHTGKLHRLSKIPADQLVVVAFLGTECPLAKHYSVRLEALAQQWSDSVFILGIFSNQQDSREEIQKFQATHQLNFPLCHDLHNRIADQFAATRTPEVFVLDHERIVQYQGRIDDQFQVGNFRNEPASEDLKNAIEDLLAGKMPRVAHTEAVGCVIGRERIPSKTAKVTYSEQISRLFQGKCVSCHRDKQAAPFSLTSYEEARGWAGMIEEVVRENRMPPWHADPAIGQFQNDCHLEDAEKQLIFDWVAAGAPEGDPQKLPAPLKFSSDWQLPRAPDQIIAVTDDPVLIPAQGTVKYKYYQVDPGFTEDRWVQGAEIRPSNLAVVHHVLVFARSKGTRKLAAEEGGFLAAYVPGLIPELYPAGMAKKLPANSELIFQMHYTPIGSEQEDLSQLGLIFADPETITHQVVTSSAINRHFEIPPYEDNHAVTGRSPKADQAVQLLAMMPHMHLRGKAFSYAAHFPDGTETPLLSVPKYDFNWQTAYRLQQPLTLPAGTQLVCEARFDNSQQNPFNPDPSKTVRWGDQTWEEMMIGYFDVAVPYQTKSEEKETQVFGSRPAQIITRLDANGDGEITRDEIPKKWLPYFFLIDTDRNQRITREELEQMAKKMQKEAP